MTRLAFSILRTLALAVLLIAVPVIVTDSGVTANALWARGLPNCGTLEPGQTCEEKCEDLGGYWNEEEEECMESEDMYGICADSAHDAKCSYNYLNYGSPQWIRFLGYSTNRYCPWHNELSCTTCCSSPNEFCTGWGQNHAEEWGDCG